MKRIARELAVLTLALIGTAAQAQYNAQFIEVSKAWGSMVADFNGDGHDDFLISGHDTDDRLWYWSPAGYVPSAQALEWVDRHACSPADFNQDGLLDFYCTVGADRGGGVGMNELWLQDAAGIFHKSTDHGAADPYGRGRVPIVFDMNHDGLPDIYVTNEATIRSDGEININHVFINQGGGAFVELPTLATGARGFQCVHKGDIDQDGWDDLVVCNGAKPGHIYRNNQAGDFVEVQSAAIGTNWRDAKLADMNRDGRDDLIVLTGANDLQIWLNSGSGQYYESAPAYSNHIMVTGKSLTVGDFNADGLRDVYVVLQKADCQRTTLHDIAPDLIYQGRANGTWAKIKQPQDYDGCGHQAATVDGSRVLLMNGGVAYPGPNYLIRWLN